jgi:hypothetical protein
MYEWLDDEIRTIKTRGFHVVDGPVSGEHPSQANAPQPKFPPSYREFVSRFGGAKLYKQGSSYALGVLAAPKAAQSARGEPLYCIGHHDDALAYLRGSQLMEDHESPVYEWGVGGLRQAADSFESWLVKRSDRVRHKIGKRAWEEIVEGPVPFSKRELEIITARREFVWRFLGVQDSGELCFEIQNNSRMVLPFLTIGIRSKVRRFEGASRLPVSHILPGTCARLCKRMYDRIEEPSNLEPFALADPQPEDRDFYWEFRHV